MTENSDPVQSTGTSGTAGSSVKTRVAGSTLTPKPQDSPVHGHTPELHGGGGSGGEVGSLLTLPPREASCSARLPLLSKNQLCQSFSLKHQKALQNITNDGLARCCLKIYIFSATVKFLPFHPYVPIRILLPALFFLLIAKKKNWLLINKFNTDEKNKIIPNPNYNNIHEIKTIKTKVIKKTTRYFCSQYTRLVEFSPYSLRY